MTPNGQVRRATVEDVPQLIPLWKAESLSWEDLERRFREFQVVEGEGQTLLGAIGLSLAGREGCLHSEVFAHPEQSDQLREMLFERARVIAANHGLVRLWTELAAPFWHMSGFQQPSEDILAKRSPAFGAASNRWRVVLLKEESSNVVSIEKEFAMFREAEQERTQQMMRRAKLLKAIAVVIAVALFALVLVWAILFLRAQSHLRPN